MNYDEAIQKVAKLLRLSQSPNPNEAALAASKAQEIIDRFKIESTALNYAANGDAQPDEPIQDFASDPLDAGAGKISSWSWRLFLALGKANGVKGYSSRLGGIAIVGRASDVSTVRYLYAWLKREVERLAKADCRGHGRTWANNYRIGVVETVAQRLAAQTKQTQQDVVAEIQARQQAEEVKKLALVRVQMAIANIQKREAEAQSWMDVHLNLRKCSASRTRFDNSARQAGRAAGHSIRMQPVKAHIG